MKLRLFFLLLFVPLLMAPNPGQGPWECSWGSGCFSPGYLDPTFSGTITGDEAVAGSTPGGGLYEGLPIAATSSNEWMHYRWEFMDDGEDLYWDTDAIAGSVSFNCETDVVGGHCQFLSSSTLNEGGSASFTDPNGAGAFLLPATGRTIIFETRMRVQDYDLHTFLMGVIDAVELNLGNAPLAADASWNANVTDFVGFYNDGNAASGNEGIVECGYEANDGTFQDVDDATSLLTGSAWHRFGLRIEGLRTLKWYVDGVEVCTDTAAADIDANLTLVFLLLNENGAGNREINVDYVDVWQTRLAGDD